MLNKLNNFLSSIFPAAKSDNRPEHTLQLATAVLLIEVMRSDAETGDEEQAAILDILKRRFHLSDIEVAQLNTLGLHTAKAANDFYQFTSVINRELQFHEKIHIIEYMWQVAYADGTISAHENHLLRKISELLYISHGEFIAAKMRAKHERFA